MSESSALVPVSDELVVVPGTGEVVSLNDAEACARALAAVRDFEYRIKDAKRALTDALVAESERQGTKTLRLADGLTATIGAETETEWDVEILWELREAGLPEPRLMALVRETVTYSPDGRVANQISKANPAYAEIIERARRRTPKRPYASVNIAAR